MEIEEEEVLEEGSIPQLDQEPSLTQKKNKLIASCASFLEEKWEFASDFLYYIHFNN